VLIAHNYYMKNDKKHLNIDLEFLDKKEPHKVTPKPKPPKGNEPNWRYYNPNNVNSKTGKKYNWKNILIISGVVLFFGWVILSASNNSTSLSTSNSSYAPPTPNENSVSNGQYSCSSYQSSQADSLKPKITLADLDWAEQDLITRSNALDALAAKIDNTYVDESNQYSLNMYNQLVNEHNTKLETLKKDIQTYERKLNQFNLQTDTYNNYLDANCTKIR